MATIETITIMSPLSCLPKSKRRKNLTYFIRPAPFAANYSSPTLFGSLSVHPILIVHFYFNK